MGKANTERPTPDTGGQEAGDQRAISEMKEVRSGIIKRFVQVIVQVAVIAAILFLSSGRPGWLWGWVFVGLYLVGILIGAVFLLRYSPRTIAKRAESQGMKDWDKVVGGLWAVMYFVVMLGVAGLDERFGWTGTLGLGIHLGGAVAFALGFGFFGWSMVANAHFSTVVRVEEEEHAVCDRGPYGFVRHPGYISAIVQSLAAPLVLGSLWALIPGALAAVLMTLRTALEDRTLQEELEGYKEYTQRVRYRLVPGVW